MSSIKITAVAQPRFYLQIPHALVARLMDCSTMHYDSTCRAASVVGGFIYGWSNATRIVDESDAGAVSVSCTVEQADLTLKILELPLFSDAQGHELMDDFRRALGVAVRAALASLKTFELHIGTLPVEGEDGSRKYGIIQKEEGHGA